MYAVDNHSVSARAATAPQQPVLLHPLLRLEHGMISDWLDKAHDGEHQRPLKDENHDAADVDVPMNSSAIEANGDAGANDCLEAFDRRSVAASPSKHLNGYANGKTKQPIFRLPAIDTNLSALPSAPRERAGNKRESSHLSTRSLPPDSGFNDSAVHQLILALKTKMRSSFVELRKRFIDNDPEQKGKISRDALKRLVMTISGRLVPSQVMNKMLDLVGLGEKSTIEFDEFVEKICMATGDSEWLASRRFNRAFDTSRSAISSRASSAATLPLVAKQRVANANNWTSKSDGAKLNAIAENENNDVKMAAKASEIPHTDRESDVRIEADSDNSTRLRSAEEVDAQVRAIFAKQFNQLEREFRELDELNSNWLSIETMETLFARLNAQPVVTRAEIERHLWPRFFLRHKAKLDFWEFCRYFMYSKDSASFPNAKRHPPRRGDADYILRSLEVNSDSDLVRSSIRTTIDMCLDELRVRCLSLDPSRTGSILRADFRKMLREMEPDINEYELYMLSQRYKADPVAERISYVDFLAPYFARKLPPDHTSQQDKMDFLLAQSTSMSEFSASKDSEAYKNTKHFILQNKPKLTMKKNQLRRAFHSLDSDSCGFLNIVELRAVLRLIAGLEIGKQDWFEILNELDTQLSGKVDYRRFLEMIEEQKVERKEAKKKNLKELISATDRKA